MNLNLIQIYCAKIQINLTCITTLCLLPLSWRVLTALGLRKFWTWHQSHLTKILCQVEWDWFFAYINLRLNGSMPLVCFLCSWCILALHAGDKSALAPGGIRIGTPALTTRGFRESDFKLVAEMIHEGVNIAIQAKGLASGTKLKDFMDLVQSSDFPMMGNVMDLKRRVEAFATQFPLPGVWEYPKRVFLLRVRHFVSQEQCQFSDTLCRKRCTTVYVFVRISCTL